MQRLNVYLPKPLINRLQQLSAESGVSVAEVIRNILREHLQPTTERKGKS